MFVQIIDNIQLLQLNFFTIDIKELSRHIIHANKDGFGLVFYLNWYVFSIFSLHFEFVVPLKLVHGKELYLFSDFTCDMFELGLQSFLAFFICWNFNFLYFFFTNFKKVIFFLIIKGSAMQDHHSFWALIVFLENLKEILLDQSCKHRVF